MLSFEAYQDIYLNLLKIETEILWANTLLLCVIGKTHRTCPILSTCTYVVIRTISKLGYLIYLGLLLEMTNETLVLTVC